jgi:hypothetical protein
MRETRDIRVAAWTRLARDRARPGEDDRAVWSVCAPDDPILDSRGSLPTLQPRSTTTVGDRLRN